MALKSWQEHKWTLESRIEAQDGIVQLHCVDPCDYPYDDKTNTRCVCVWNKDDPLDLVLEELPVRVVAHEDLNYGTSGWEWDEPDPGWLRLAAPGDEFYERVAALLSELKDLSTKDYPPHVLKDKINKVWHEIDAAHREYHGVRND